MKGARPPSGLRKRHIRALDDLLKNSDRRLGRIVHIERSDPLRDDDVICETAYINMNLGAFRRWQGPYYGSLTQISTVRYDSDSGRTRDPRMKGRRPADGSPIY